MEGLKNKGRVAHESKSECAIWASSGRGNCTLVGGRPPPCTESSGQRDLYTRSSSGRGGLDARVTGGRKSAPVPVPVDGRLRGRVRWARSCGLRVPVQVAHLRGPRLQDPGSWRPGRWRGGAPPCGQRPGGWRPGRMESSPGRVVTWMAEVRAAGPGVLRACRWELGLAVRTERRPRDRKVLP